MKNESVGVRLMGGLGNQMFQIAFGVALRVNTGSPVFYDDGGYSGDRYARRSGASSFPRAAAAVRGTGGPIGLKSRKYEGFARRLWRLVPTEWSKCYFEHRSFLYDPLAFETPDALYFYGYWQSFRYFQNHYQRIKEEFEPSKHDLQHTETLRSIASNRCGIAMHIRRFNEVSAKSGRNSLYQSIDADYCYRSLKRIRRNRHAPVFIFTDDPNWCRTNLRIPGEAVIVAERAKLTDAQEMLVMRSCRRHIISNSTFGWWGAWLAESEAVIYPKYWPDAIGQNWRDFIPPTWTGE